jgi:hypothetical protein
MNSIGPTPNAAGADCMAAGKTRNANSAPRRARSRLLRGARVYLSGPMDFVASRANEKAFGWRNRIGDVLRHYGVTVFDPWTKPEVRGFHEYGIEGATTTSERDNWTFKPGPSGARQRSASAAKFWPALHIDLRMVDTSDFVVCYCPTNVYSVGTPHEIILCRQQRKPVLFVSPRVDFPALHQLRSHLDKKHDTRGAKLLATLESQVPIKPNPGGMPSLWYMPLIGAEHFFDGFGFARYRRKFRNWRDIRLDDEEERNPPRRPLLPFLEGLSRQLPKKWDRRLDKYVDNDDWLLWDMSRNS